MNNLQKLELHSIMDQSMCELYWKVLPNDVICTAEINTQNVCTVSSKLTLIKVQDTTNRNLFFLDEMCYFLLKQQCLSVTAR